MLSHSNLKQSKKPLLYVWLEEAAAHSVSWVSTLVRMTWAVLLKTHWPNNWWLICVWNSYIGCHSSSTTLLAGADPEMEERECTDCCTCSVELAMCQAHSIVRGSEGMLPWKNFQTLNFWEYFWVHQELLLSLAKKNICMVAVSLVQWFGRTASCGARVRKSVPHPACNPPIHKT